MRAQKPILTVQHLAALILIAAMGVYIAVLARADLRQHVYAVCLGTEGTGYKVTAAEKASCACKTEAALSAVPVKSRVPRWLVRLSSRDWGDMLIAQAVCVKGQG